MDDFRRRLMPQPPTRIPPTGGAPEPRTAAASAAIAPERAGPTPDAPSTLHPPVESTLEIGLGHDPVSQLDDVARRVGELEQQVVRMQRLSAMGTMSAMLAHEFRNLLTPVVSYVQYALGRPDAEIVQKALQTTLRNTQTAAALCERIMRMARDEPAEPVVGSTALADVVDDAMACLGRELPRDGITPDVKVAAGLRVRMDRVELQQVLFNLFLNARQAMLDRGGILTIRGAVSGPGTVRISVSDTGPGIRGDDLPRLFDAFFTTRRGGDSPDRRGLGLGLTVCSRLIHAAGGTISAESRWGEGATFHVDLPGGE